MAATKYLDYNGLLYFWTLIKNMFAKPSSASPQMDGTASAGSSALYARGDHVHPSDTAKADNATTLAGYGITDAYTKAEIDQNKADKATTLAGYGITDAYTKSEIDTKLTGGMHYKGSVQTTADLPASGNEIGDFYNVIATGENWAWDGTTWDKTGSIVDLQPITNAEIDTIVAS